VDRQITPHIPVWDKSARSDGTFSRADFVFDRSRNIYICPNGKLLHTTGTVIDGSTLRYRASKLDCDACAFKMQCCPHTPARQIPRDLHEDARDVARALAKTEAFEQSRRERKKVEMRFAHMKRIFKLDRLRLRGLSGARDEVLLTATAQNLRRLAKFLCRAPPVTCAA
jgi:Transposase DDE domain